MAADGARALCLLARENSRSRSWQLRRVDCTTESPEVGYLACWLFGRFLSVGDFASSLRFCYSFRAPVSCVFSDVSRVACPGAAMPGLYCKVRDALRDSLAKSAQGSVNSIAEEPKMCRASEPLSPRYFGGRAIPFRWRLELNLTTMWTK